MLEELTEDDLARILVAPENALVKQYQKLFAIDGVTLTFTEGRCGRSRLLRFAGHGRPRPSIDYRKNLGGHDVPATKRDWRIGGGGG